MRDGNTSLTLCPQCRRVSSVDQQWTNSRRSNVVSRSPIRSPQQVEGALGVVTGKTATTGRGSNGLRCQCSVGQHLGDAAGHAFSRIYVEKFIRPMGVRMRAENSGHKEMTSGESVSQHFHEWDSPARSHGHHGGSKKSFGTLFERG